MEIQHIQKYISHILVPLVLGIFFLLPSLAHAQIPTVTPESDPLFNLDNVVPGTVVSRTIDITNDSGQAQDVYTDSANDTGSAALASTLELTITSGATTYFSGTFADFFAAPPQALGTLSNSDARTYTFTASLPNSAPSTLQGTTIGFDLLIGFEGGGAVILSGTGGGGGGGGSSRRPSGQVAGDSIGPVPQVAGAQTSIIPQGAPNTGFGGEEARSYEALLLLMGSLFLIIRRISLRTVHAR